MAITLTKLETSAFGEALDIETLFEGRKSFPRGTKSVLRAVKRYLQNQRQGTVMTKGKGMVSGGGKKPFKQKGTGNARQGSSRSPLMPGGGVAHGPKPRVWWTKINKKELRLAFRAAVADHMKTGSMFLVNGLTKDSGSKSKNWRKAFDKKMNTVLVTGNLSEVRGAKNFEKITLANVKTVNVYDLAWAKRVVFTDQDSVEAFKQRLKA